MAVAIREKPLADEPTVDVQPSGPRMPKRTAWVPLPDSYGEAGMELLVWTNYSHAVGNALRGLKGTEAFKEALADVALAHNGWLDEDGEPLPPMDADFWWSDAISDELVGVVLVLLGDVPQRFPKGLRTSGGS